MGEPSEGQQQQQHHQDSREYWGYLFQKNKCATQKLDRLLRGIAACITSNFHRHDSNDLTPTQLAAFYRSVGGDYDPLFLHMPAPSIAFIYKSLGCLHSIQPNPADDGYTAPSIPALKPAGFVTWQTIQLLLGPHEHIPFMQRALQLYDVRDPVDGKPFPKDLPREAFPSRPDEHMVAWHAGVSERLRLEAAEAERERASLDDRTHRSRASSTDFSTDGSTDERADAAQYFSNPFNKDPDGRPAIVRAITKAVPKSMVNGGLLVGNTVRNIASPFLWSRRRTSSSSSERNEKPRSHRYSNEDADSTPTENGRSASSWKRDNQRHHHHHREHSKHSPRRNDRASTSSETDPDSPVLQHHSPRVRRHRSYDPPQSPREYFGAYNGYHGPTPNSLPKESQYSQHNNKKPQQQQHYDPRRRSSRSDDRDHDRDRSHSHPRHGNGNRTPPPSAPQNSQSPSSPPLTTSIFGPSESPPFAAKVAHIQHQQGSSGSADPSSMRRPPQPQVYTHPRPMPGWNSNSRGNGPLPSRYAHGQGQGQGNGFQGQRQGQQQRFQGQGQAQGQQRPQQGLWSQGLWTPANGADGGGRTFPRQSQGMGKGNMAAAPPNANYNANTKNNNNNNNNAPAVLNGVGGRMYPAGGF